MMTISNAIFTSIETTSVVGVELDHDDIHREITQAWSGDYDCEWVDNRNLDVWGWDDDTPDGQQSWRLLVTMPGDEV
jgi:hypothetical protein